MIYFKELAHVIMGAGKSEVCREGRQTGDQVGVAVAVLSLEAEDLLPLGTSVSSLKVFNWLDAAHPQYGG